MHQKKTSVARIQEETTEARTRFLLTEADTGNVLANVALSAENPAKLARNKANARLAYDTVLARKGEAHLTTEADKALNTKMIELRNKLLLLGEAL